MKIPDDYVALSRYVDLNDIVVIDITHVQTSDPTYILHLEDRDQIVVIKSGRAYPTEVLS